MTEDADLGLRLHRLGFRTRVITRPTFEDAPTSPAIWMPQRVRWFKGWLQTWLVMIRAPRRWWREMGARAFLASQLMIGGAPVFRAGASADARLRRPRSCSLRVRPGLSRHADVPPAGRPRSRQHGGELCRPAHPWLQRDGTAERRKIGHGWLRLPVYWLMISLCAGGRSGNCIGVRSSGTRHRICRA